LSAAIKRTEPEVIIHQLTALTGVANFKKLDAELALTNRLRTEVTDILLAAARLMGARRFIAQSFCGWPFVREGDPSKPSRIPLIPIPLPASESPWPRFATLRRSHCAMGSSMDRERVLRRME
jgi:hypothetical protein